MNQRSEVTRENDVTLNAADQSREIEAERENGSSSDGLTTADIANGGQQADRNPREQQPTEHLFPADRLTTLREQWSSIQTSFVDEPKSSVEKADELVADVIQTLAKRFAEERGRLEQQWSGGGEASTEDLRKALQHYRSFFERLLAA